MRRLVRTFVVCKTPKTGFHAARSISFYYLYQWNTCKQLKCSKCDAMLVASNLIGYLLFFYAQCSHAMLIYGPNGFCHKPKEYRLYARCRDWVLDALLQVSLTYYLGLLRIWFQMLLNKGVAIILWCALTTYTKQRMVSPNLLKGDGRRWIQ